MNKRSIAALIAGLVTVIGAPAALATPNTTQYGNVAGTVAKEKVKPVAKASPAVAKASGTLPFTGLNLVIVLGAGGLALGTGVALRRLGREPRK